MSVFYGRALTVGGSAEPKFTYTGVYKYFDDGSGNWRIKFFTSGVLISNRDLLVDVFLVGGGAGGGYAPLQNETPGGGSGYTKTVRSVQLSKNTQYNIIIGAGGEAKSSGGKSSALGYEVSGGNPGTGVSTQAKGGNGGSGGGGRSKGKGGVDGANGGGINGGTGQGTTTREFGESSGELYATGGSSSGTTNKGESGKACTGDGGSGGESAVPAGTGGSGIVIIRKHKA